MKTIETTIYRCEHCNKLYLLAKACEKHENGCTRNPDNSRPCFTCAHCVSQDVIYHHDTWDGYASDKRAVFFCKKKSVALYPPSVERKKTWFDSLTLGDADIENVAMPKECDLFGNFFTGKPNF